METLDQRITRDGPLNELDAVGWAIRLARRLEALHALGVAHGSVSPACFSTQAVDRNSRAVLVDLRRVPEQPAYHSPDRVHGGSVSPADDVWALAATLYAAITGSAAFSGAGPDELRQKIAAGAPPPLAVFDVGDDDLQRILDTAFSKDQAARIVKASAFREELERWHPDPTVKALPPVDAEEEETGDDEPRTLLVQDEPGKSGGGAGAVKPQLLEDDDDDKTLLRPGAAVLSTVAALRSGPLAGGPQAPAADPRLPAPRPAAGAPAVPAPPPPQASGGPPLEDDDEEDIRTIMRPAFEDRVLGLGGQHAAGRIAAARPAAGQPAVPTSPHVSVPQHAPLGSTRLEDDEDDDARTVLRDGASLLAASEGSGPRRGPLPAAGVPAVPPGAPVAPAGIGIGLGRPGGVAPDPHMQTMTATAAFPPGAFAHLGDALSQPGVPPPGGPPPGFAPPATPPPGSQHGGPTAPPGFPPPAGYQMPQSYGPGMASAHPPAPSYRFGQVATPLPDDASAPRSSIGLAILVALVALVVAAGVTFLVLRSRATGGLFGAAPAPGPVQQLHLCFEAAHVDFEGAHDEKAAILGES